MPLGSGSFLFMCASSAPCASCQASVLTHVSLPIFHCMSWICMEGTVWEGLSQFHENFKENKIVRNRITDLEEGWSFTTVQHCRIANFNEWLYRSVEKGFNVLFCVLWQFDLMHVGSVEVNITELLQKRSAWWGFSIRLWMGKHASHWQNNPWWWLQLF